ncbi:hypothetical protein AKJ09_06741 [Labilithrix luteola]|uniref:Fibronectin type-III domain-containing protein n=1 Tax=Labilithrix luteola TaxID=1391654 RepID=A0A0K1Q2W4_9BACT|nr:hypothetical protein [Labilithrix luteola]AKV00078.1 hypothetical protein AKJ09_06741 [Labilithrix luteola]
MRKHLWLAAVPLVLAGAIAACGGDDTTSGNGTNAGADGGGPANDVEPVVVRTIERDGFSNGKLTDKTLDWFVGLSAIVTVDGVTKTIAGTVDRATGVGTIAGVPHVPFVLEMREGGENGAPLVIRRYPSSELRSVRLGPNYWRRGDTVAMTSDTRLALTIDAPQSFNDSSFWWLSPESQFARRMDWVDPTVWTSPNETNVPGKDATSATDWTAGGDALVQPYGADASGLPVAASGDHLFLLQNQWSTFAGPPETSNAWHNAELSSVVGMIAYTDETLANGTVNTLRGTLASPPTEKVSLDFRGSTFAAFRNLAKYPPGAYAAAEIAVTREVGPGPELFAATTIPSWALFSNGEPDGVRYDDPGDLAVTLDLPHLQLPNLREFVNTTYTWGVKVNTRAGEVLYTTASTVMHRKTSTTITSALELGPVQNLTVGDSPLGWDGQGVVQAGDLTVRFDAPALGTPEYYVVKASLLRPRKDYEGDTSYGVAYITTRETSAVIPADVLRPGSMYFVSVAAVRDGSDFAEPTVVKSEDAVSTSIFSPPFVVQ